MKQLKSLASALYDSFSVILVTLSLILSLGCIYINISERITGEMTFLLGYKAVFIESGSMEPEIRTGSVVIVEEASYEDVNVGDIIVFETDEGYVTHRLKGVDEEALSRKEPAFLITQGDANNIEDFDRLDPAKIRGIVRFH